ncbi:MAG: hypothetical protein IJW32_02600 [Clostridia bacterium]|nr:hypothetical protein [Clostridia bacterium]
MQFLDKKESKETFDNIKTTNDKNKNFLWIIRISVLAFCLSLLLSLFSEIILNKSNIVVAIILLVVFMSLNIISDMYGLAITSCQIDKLKSEKMSEVLYSKCIKLIKNSDKVSSILCDVVGDICGILCGVSGTMVALICAPKINFLSINILFSAIVSASVVALTVFLKAITKKYAVKNSLKLVKRSAKIISILKYIITLVSKGKNAKRELL